MNRMAKRWFLILCSIFFIGIGLSFTSYAYTEEEIQQAKAWLSAHGYSPDSGGASQAYQDYLDGKFDEELGINTTEESSETPAQTATTESVTTEATQDRKQTSADEKEQREEATTAQEKRNSGEAPSSVPDTGTESENAAQKDMEQMPQSQAEEIDAADASAEHSDPQDLSDEETDDDKQTGGISIFRKENIDTYKEAGLVILLSVLLVAVFKAIVLLLR